MQGLIAIVAVIVGMYAIIWIKNQGYSFIASLRILIKRLALYVMSFSWVVVLATVFLMSHYANIVGLFKSTLSADSVEGIKSTVRLVFGVDSAFAALQMLAFYSIMASFVSCLVLSLGVVVRIVYRAILKAARTSFVEKRKCFEDFNQHSLPTFKLYLKYNS